MQPGIKILIGALSLSLISAVVECSSNQHQKQEENMSENVEHWHGATADSRFVHIAITNYKGDQNVVWLEPVSDQDYQEVNKQ